MGELLIRNLEPELIKSLKLRAKMHNRSLQSELKCIIEAAAKMSTREALQTTTAWQERLSKGSFTDSTHLIREDRDKK